MSDEFDIQNALQAYAPPVADNGFTMAALKQADRRQALRLPILTGAATIGGAVMLSQIPTLWALMSQIDIPSVSPLAITALGVLGFVAWAALDKGWSDAV